MNIEKIKFNEDSEVLISENLKTSKKAIERLFGGLSYDESIEKCQEKGWDKWESTLKKWKEEGLIE